MCADVKERLILACHRGLSPNTYISSLSLSHKEKYIWEKMAGNNPRKFKDRIALLNQKQAESTEQFEVRKRIMIINRIYI